MFQDGVNGGHGLLVVIRPDPAERTEATKWVQGVIDNLSIQSRVEYCSDRAVMFAVWVPARMSVSKFRAALKREYRKAQSCLLLSFQIDDEWSTIGDFRKWESLQDR